MERLVASRLRQRSAVAGSAALAAVDVLALEHLAGAEELSPTDLGRRLQLSSSGTSAVIGRLVRRGLVSRRADPANRRRAAIAPTPDGRAVVGFSGELSREVDALVGGLANAEREAVQQFVLALADLSDRLADRLAAEAEAEARAASGVPRPTRWG